LNKENFMKKIISSSLTVVLIFAFNACGTSDSKNAESLIPIEACIVPPVISSYQVLNSGDIIVDESNTSVVTTYHESSNIKRICLESGKASILRVEN